MMKGFRYISSKTRILPVFDDFFDFHPFFIIFERKLASF